jgi:hypothetical protein
VTTRTPSETTAALTEALVARDRDTLSGLLAPDVRFFSPAYAEPVVGREVVTQVLGTASEVYSDLRFDEPRTSGAEAVTFFTATVPGPDGAAPVALEGCYRAVTADGRVSALTAYFRPLAGLQALVAGVMAARAAGS